MSLMWAAQSSFFMQVFEMLIVTRTAQPVAFLGDREMNSRPEGCNTEHLEFLDELRESGKTNMFGARPLLMDEFMMGSVQSQAVLSYWMKTFGNDDR